MKSDFTLGTKDGKQFQEFAESFGFRLIRRDSAGHAIWFHPSFGEYKTSSTPRSKYAWKHARRGLWLLMGVKPPTDKRRAHEPLTATNRLVIQARNRGHGFTQEQARILLERYDGDLGMAEGDLGRLCDRWDRRKTHRLLPRRRRRPLFVEPVYRFEATVYRQNWPEVQERIRRELHDSLRANGMRRAREMAREMNASFA